MFKKLKMTMLLITIATQCGPFAFGSVLLASELSASSELSSNQALSANSETSQSEIISETSSEVTSDLESEVMSETSSEVTSDLESEVMSETSSEVTSDLESEVESELTSSVSEVVSESEVESEVIDIKAELTIDQDGAVTDNHAVTPTAFRTNEQLAENENISGYENTQRLSADSGEATIEVQLEEKNRSLSEDLKDTPVYFVIDENGEISTGSTKQPRSYEGNLITVVNGVIVDSDNAIVRTSGGYDKTFYVYETIEDLQSNTNGIPYSGGGFDGTFIESVYQDGVYYDHIKIAGFEGYTQAGNIQIIPEELIKAHSYYTAEDGDWVYYSAIDPLTSTEYDKMAIGSAPEAAQTGEKYYTDDDVNFYTEEILTNAQDITPAVSYNSYFMNLPFRSASNYTATDYKNYLKAKGHTDSEYYNETTAFTKAQSYESVNSLMMFAMANHESAYGTSKYARACYNFFGRGAVDSDPDQACEYYNYNTATAGIMAQTLFLENGYFDVLDWRYSGMHVGDKASGMNVKYASDPDWGKKISNHAYMMDQYKGGKEENKYPILQVTGVKHVYQDSSLKTNVKSSSDGTKLDFYDLSQMAGTSNTVNVVALEQTSDAYKIQVPTAVKQSSSTECSFTGSKRGSYPDYEGRSNVSVANNTANYSCDYIDMASNQFWISKSGTKVINNKSVPNQNNNIYQYYSNGEVKYQFVIDPATEEIEYAYGYDQNGEINRKFTYQSGTKYGNNHQNHYKTIYYIDNGSLYKAITYTADQHENFIYTYYDGATLDNAGDKIKYRFNIGPATGYIVDAYRYTEGKDHKRYEVFTYNEHTKYGEHGTNIRYCFVLDPNTGDIEKANEYRNGSSKGGYQKIYTYQPGTKYGQQSLARYDDVYWLEANNVIDYAVKYKNGERYIKYSYEPGTVYGHNHGDHITNRYYY